MTVTEIGQKANPPSSSGTSSAWGRGDPKSCWKTITRRHDDRVYQVAVSCKQLDCEDCGVRIRQADYERATQLFAQEQAIWVIYVRAHMVDRLRKQAARAGEPIASVPVSDDWNIVFSPYRFSGSYQLTETETRRILLEYRTSRRHFTMNGRWAQKRKTQQAPINGELLSRGGISPQAFVNVAKKHGMTVVEQRDARYFDDPLRRSSAFWRPLFLQEEHRLRLKRMKARGWAFKGGRWSAAA